MEFGGNTRRELPAKLGLGIRPIYRFESGGNWRVLAYSASDGWPLKKSCSGGDGACACTRRRAQGWCPRHSGVEEGGDGAGGGRLR
jgi:hypothetical protein